MKNKIKCICKAISTWWCVNSALLLVWVFLSWIEILSKNMTPNPVYNPLNFVEILIKMSGN